MGDPIERALAIPGLDEPESAAPLLIAGDIEGAAGRTARANAYYADAAAVFEELGDSEGIEYARARMQDG